jgi:Na+/melibiose symporter-like transporter
MTLLPVIFYIVSFIIIKKKYIIDEALYETIITEINARKEVEA